MAISVNPLTHIFKCGYGTRWEKAHSFFRTAFFNDSAPLKICLNETGRLSLESHQSESVWRSRKL